MVSCARRPVLCIASDRVVAAVITEPVTFHVDADQRQPQALGRAMIAVQEGVNLVESLNGRFREECLNDTLFSTLAEARSAINSWKEDYNHHRPHSALGKMTPAEFALKATMEKQAA